MKHSLKVLGRAIVAGSLALAGILPAAQSASGSTCVTPPAGIAAWWQAEGNTVDAVHGLSATPVGNLTYSNGEVGLSFVFDGSTSYIPFPASSNLDIGAKGSGITIEGWINPQFAGALPIVEWDSPSANGVLLWVEHDQTLSASVTDTNNVNHDIITPYNVITNNTWQHVALTYDKTSGNAVLYVNGAALVTNNLGSFVPETAEQMNIGRRTASETGNGDTFEGLIDELSLYTRALNPSEIQAIYDAGSAGKCYTNLAPLIVTQPLSRTNTVGTTATFTVAASGAPLLGYQWYSNSVAVNNTGHDNGAKTTTLIISNVTTADAAGYSVIVSNLYGSATSTVATLTVTVPSSTGCTPPPAGIAAWWQAEGNTVDAIHGLSATPVGNLTYSNGEVGLSFVFDGSTSYIPFPASSNLDIGAKGSGITIEGWINPQFAGALPIVEWDSPSANGVLLWVEHNHTLFASIVDTNNNNHEIISPFDVIATNTWQHVAVTYNQASGNATLYLNGAIIATNNLGSFTPETSYPMNIGRRTASETGNGDTFEGLIDELSLYTRALSPAEIQAIYNAGSAGKCYTNTTPVIVTQPLSRTNTVGTTATFSVAASGTPLLGYQWYSNSVPVNNTGHDNGAKTITLIISNVTSADAAGYSVIVSNLYGSATSTVATLTVTVPSSTGCTPPPAGIAAWWQAEGNTVDAVHGLSATPVGNLTYSNGEVGLSFVFDGSTSYIPFPASSNLDIGAKGSGITIEGWINPQFAGALPIVEWDSPSANGVLLWVEHDQTLSASVTDTNNVNHDIITPYNVITNNTWQHVALTYDKTSGNAVLYVNGAALVTNNLGSFVPETAEQMNIGRRTASETGNGDTFEGLIDELSLYTRALNPSEIQAIYDAGSAGKCYTNLAPLIVTQPLSRTNTVGTTATFTVAASGAPLLGYQWYSNSVAVNNTGHDNGAKTTTLIISNVTTADAAGYSVIVSNLYGSATSTVATLTVTVPSSTGCTPPPAGIAAWWQAEGNTVDAIHGLSATPVGNLTYSNGEVGLSFVFDGSTSYIPFPASSNLDIGAKGSGITIEGWINPQFAGALPIVEWDSPSANGVLLWVEHDQTLSASVTDTNNVNHDIITPYNVITNNTWQHVALTYDKTSGNAVLYVNGAALVTNNLGSFVPETAEQMNIGRRTASETGNGDTFEGLIDELSLYTRALNPSEIQAIYDAGSAGKCTGGVTPSIIIQPSSQTNFAGTATSFTVAASGPQPLKYQWNCLGTNINGATNSVLVLPCVQRGQAGTYAVTVNNDSGSAVSSNAILKVLTPQTLSTPTIMPDHSICLSSKFANGDYLQPSDLSNCEAQASTDLINWVTLTNALTLTNGTLFLQDCDRTNFNIRYYRIYQQ